MKKNRIEMVYKTPLVEVQQVNLEQCIAASKVIEGDINSATETWNDTTIDTGDIELI